MPPEPQVIEGARRAVIESVPTLLGTVRAHVEQAQAYARREAEGVTTIELPRRVTAGEPLQVPTHDAMVVELRAARRLIDLVLQGTEAAHG